MGKDQERDAGASGPGAILSDGEDAAKAYAIGAVGPRPLLPTEEMERIRIEDPRRMPPPTGNGRKGSGPRNPEQKAPLANKAELIWMPAGLPVTKLQPIEIDRELLQEWRDERDALERAAAAAAGGARAERAEPTAKATAETRVTIAPVVAQPAQREARGRSRAIVAAVVVAIAAVVALGVWRRGEAGRESAVRRPEGGERAMASAPGVTDVREDGAAAARAGAEPAGAPGGGAAVSTSAAAIAPSAGTAPGKATASRESARPRAVVPRNAVSPAARQPASVASAAPAPERSVPPEFYRPEETQ